MFRSGRSSLRRRLALLFTLALVPAFAASLFIFVNERARLRREASASTARLAQLLAAHFESTLASTYDLLRTLDHLPAVVDGTCEEMFADFLSATPGRYSGLAVMNEAGAVMCSAPRASGGSPVLRGEPFFDRLSSGIDFTVGPARIGELSGKLTVLAAHPFRAANGSRRAVVAGVELARLSALAGRINLPDGATFTIVESEGTVIARYPDPAAWIGVDTSDSPVTRQLLQRPAAAGSFEGTGRDGVPRVFGYAPLDAGGTRFFVVVTVPEATIKAQASSVLIRNLAGVSVAAVLAVTFVTTIGQRWFGRPLYRMLETVARIGRGDLEARAAIEAPGELGGLARGIDDMANRLQARDRDVAALSRRVLDVQERERREIARELHDEIGQSLTAIKLLLQANRPPADAAPVRWLDESVALSDRVLQQVRSLSLNLRPAMLDHLGLAATLRWYAQRESARTGLCIRLEIDPPDLRIDAQDETALFRIAQEALTNVARHAGASEAVVRLARYGTVIQLVIADDGRGFDVAAARGDARGGASLGVLGMEERAMLSGGYFELLSTPGSGTEVRVTLPLRPGSVA